MTILRPFKFKTNNKRYLWGGNRLAAFKGIDSNEQNVGESWELSGINGRESVVAEGDDKGLTITQLIEKYKDELVGTEVYSRFGSKLPLLVKLIDSGKDLSIQVHPVADDPATGATSKDELWFVVDAQPEASVSVGLRRDITLDEFDQLVSDGQIASAVNKYTTKPGDAYLVKAGNIHSIGAGNLVVEIQKPSDTTYRINDYGRLDCDGKPRELHIEKARQCVNLKACDGRCSYDTQSVNKEVTIVSEPEFHVTRIRVDDSYDMPMREPHAFKVIVCTKGKFVITDNNGKETPMRQGETVLIPANDTLIVLDGCGDVITATIR